MRLIALLGMICVLSAEPHRILFTRIAPYQTGLFISNADGSGERALLPASGLDYNPAWSPDGQWIVFTSERDGSADLYRVKTDGAGLERLTDSPAYDDQAAFAPDGSRIVFVTTRAGGKANLWILDLRSRQATALTSGPGGDFRPSWSPDGKWIAFSSDRGSGFPKAKGRWEHLQPAGIYLIHPDGSGLKRITEQGNFCGSPKWSPDSKRVVAYSMSSEETWTYRVGRLKKGETQLVSIDLAGGATGPVTTGAGVKMYPSVLPSGEVAYVRKDDYGPHGIFYGAGKPGPAGEVRCPSWSPDGARLVYHKILSTKVPAWQKAWSGNPEYEFIHVPQLPSFHPSGERFVATQRDGKASNLSVIESGSDTARVILHDDSRIMTAAQWSPQGDAIFFSIIGPTSAFGNFGAQFLKPEDRVDHGQQIAVIKPDGSGFREITSGPGNSGFPSPSPDGKRLVYRTFGPEGEGLRILNLENNASTKLTEGYDNFPSWSPRGDRIVFVREVAGDYEIFTIRPDGKDLQRLTNSPGNDAHPTFSPDGEWIIFSSARMGFKDEALYTNNPQPYGELFLMRYDGTRAQQLTDDQWEEAGAAWQPVPKTASKH
jgi:TolB protein